jgi:hypothetical protein
MSGGDRQAVLFSVKLQRIRGADLNHGLASTGVDT